MSSTDDIAKGATELIAKVESAEQSSLEAIARFVDTVDGAFPELTDDGARRKIIDSAFSMVEQLVSASNQLAQNVVDVTERALKGGDED